MKRRHAPGPARFARVLLLLALAPAVGCAALGRGATPTAPEPALAPEHFVLEGAGATVQVVAGEVRVEPASGADLVVTVTRVGADAGRLRVERSERGGKQLLRVLADSRRLVYADLPGRPDSVEFRATARGLKPGGGGFLGLFAGRSTRVVRPAAGGGAAAHADVRIELPAGRLLDVQLGAGRLVVGAAAGELHASIVGGAARATAPAGRVFIAAHAGGIVASGGTGDLTLESRSGLVNVTGFHGRRLSVSTGAGTITGSDLSASSAIFRAGAGDVGLDRVRAQRLEVRSGAGNLRVADATADTLVVRSDVGNVSLEGVHAGSARVEAGKGWVHTTGGTRVEGKAEHDITVRR